MNIDDYVDITEEFFKAVENTNESKVAKSTYFNLLEGTRAVEVSNPRLDTGMITLTEEDCTFDTIAPQSVVSVVGVMNNLIRLYVSWLQNSSLPVTIQSCRYAEVILENYDGTYLLCTFVSRRTRRDDKYDEKTFEFQLVNKVLRSFVIGVLKFVGISLQIASCTLYEEEDIVTRTLDLDYLSSVHLNAVLVDLDLSSSWLANQLSPEEGCKSIVLQLLDFLKNLLQLESILHLKIPFLKGKFDTSSFNFIQDLATSVDAIVAQDIVKYEAPSASFSKFVQLDFNNKNIPAELYMVSSDYCWSEIKKMLLEIYKYAIDSTRLKSIDQFNEFLTYEIGTRDDFQHNSIARGLFQLYLIRDDRSILGSDVSLASLTLKIMENVTCKRAEIFDDESWSSIQGTENHIADTKDHIKAKIKGVLQELETGVYHNIITLACNRCRQRQLMSRGIIVWDSLQVTCESLEMELWSNFGVGDKLLTYSNPSEDTPALPLASFVFVNKLSLMLEVALRGFELNLYRPFEMSWMYWYSSYLTKFMIDFHTQRINRINELKIEELTANLQKKIKKLKAGPKKQSLKELFDYHSLTTVPQLQLTMERNNSFVIKSFEGIHELCEGLRLMFVVLHSLELIDIFPRLELTSLENIYNLQMKPFSSVGTPMLPSFKQYLASVRLDFLEATGQSTRTNKIIYLIGVIERKVSKAKDTFAFIMNKMVIHKSNFFLGNGNKEWYHSLIKTCVMYSIELKSLSKMLSSGFHSKRNTVLICEGYNIYFPKISITSK